MSCPNATAPIDISMSKITGKCDYKCSYRFGYSNSSCVATNRGDYISILYDKSSSPPVVYNTNGYDVKELRMYTPSLHSYNGSKTDGELIIIHSSNTGSNPLLVCIPIKSNNSSSMSASLFKQLIDNVAASAPSNGETTTFNVSKFNLNYLVPKTPFFSYSATEPYQPCSEEVEYIVFGLQNSLDILSESFATLQTIITSNPYDIKRGPKLFYNEKGPIVGGFGNGEIYIDCQPVGSSDETTEIVTDMGGSSQYPTTFKDWLKNPLIKLILGAILFIVILLLVKYALGLIKPAKGGALTVESVLMGGRKK